MKKISFSFFITLIGLFLGSCSLQDHYIPPVPPQIETLEFNFVQASKTADAWLAYVNFKVKFLNLGTIPVTEYGIVYTSAPDSDTPDETPTIGGPGAHTTIFSDPVKLGEIQELDGIPQFYEMHYRAYAKLEGGEIIYGTVLHYIEEDN